MEITVTRENFESEVQNATKPVLIDFWAPWCAPCRMLGPVVAEVAKDHPEITVAKINIEEEPELADAFGVSSIPTLMLMKNGKVEKAAVGFQPKTGIEAMLS